MNSAKKETLSGLRSTIVIPTLPICSSSLTAQTALTLAPGAPGADVRWTSAGKQAVGTSNTLEYELARREFGEQACVSTPCCFANQGMMLPEQVWDKPLVRGAV